MVGENGQRQLRWAAAAITPFKSRRAVIPQIETGIQTAAVHGNANGVRCHGGFGQTRGLRQ